MRSEDILQLAQLHTRLNPDPAFFQVQFKDAFHVARAVHNDTIGQGLAVGSRSTSVGRHLTFWKHPFEAVSRSIFRSPVVLG